MKTVQHNATLFYYDGPQVIEARDRIGGHYVGVLIDTPDGEDQFAVVGIPPQQLRDFRSGVCDLRTLMLDNSKDEFWITEHVKDLNLPINLIARNGDIEALGYLPDEGFFLAASAVENDALAEDARARNNLVWEIALEPPEASEEHRIRATTFSTILALLQSLAKHAYAKAISLVPKGSRKDIDATDAALFDVVIGAAPGSFRFVLEPARPLDLLGHAELARGLERLDTLFANPGDPQATLATLHENRGHLAATYIRLMDFLVRNRTGIRYSWAQPGNQKAVSRSISEGQAKPMYESLSKAQKLVQETVIVVGLLRKVDLDLGTWRLGNSGEEGERHGKVREGGPSLSHLITDQLYSFTCEEVIEEVAGTGRELRTLFLIEARSIGEHEAMAFHGGIDS